MWGVVVLVLSLSTAEKHALRQANRGCGVTETFALTGNRNWYLTVVFQGNRDCVLTEMFSVLVTDTGA